MFVSLCSPPWAGRCTDKRFAWPWWGPAVTLMCRSCNIAGKTGLKAVFLKGMKVNVCFTM